LGQGQKPAALLGILREALAHGGVEGVRAYALLQQLGELTASDESKGPDLGTLLASSDVLQRLMAIDALQKLPTADAAPLLLKATRDPDATVRFRLVEVVAYHCTGSKRAALPALRALTEDSDIAVRARATAVLGQLQLVASHPQSLSPTKDQLRSASSPAGRPATAGTAASGPVEIQAPQSPEAVRIRQAIEQQFSLGSSLFKQGNYRAAQKALEKTSQLCGARRSDVARCSQLNSNLAYQLGVVYENLGQLANAMTEYQKVVQGAGVVRSATKRPQPRGGTGAARCSTARGRAAAGQAGAIDSV
jgi:tetratricopeptide (TPR) repeat protein